MLQIIVVSCEVSLICTILYSEVLKISKPLSLTIKKENWIFYLTPITRKPATVTQRVFLYPFRVCVTRVPLYIMLMCRIRKCYCSVSFIRINSKESFASKVEFCSSHGSNYLLLKIWGRVRVKALGCSTPKNLILTKCYKFFPQHTLLVAESSNVIKASSITGHAVTNPLLFQGVG